MKELFGGDFEMISLCMDDSDYKLRDHIEKHQLSWPQVRIGLHSKISADNGVNDQAPKYFLIGPDGRLLLTPESPDEADEKAINKESLKKYSSQVK